MFVQSFLHFKKFQYSIYPMTIRNVTSFEIHNHSRTTKIIFEAQKPLDEKTVRRRRYFNKTSGQTGLGRKLLPTFSSEIVD